MSLARRSPPGTAHARADRADPEPDPEPEGSYVGLVTRTIAFAVDAALVNAVAVLTGAVVTLAASVLSLPSEVQTIALAIGGAAYVLWTATYFVTCWSTTGQTVGARLMRFRVRTYRGEQLPPRRALLRFVGLVLAALPLFAGFLLIPVDDRRRGLQDLLARTVVVDAYSRRRPSP